MRRSHYNISAPGMVTCPKCGEMILAHRVCPNCGNYNGKQVVEKKEEK
jgi:large subunit ribosomal protein L32